MRQWPVPVHIRACILLALNEAARQRGETCPLWVFDAVSQGIRDAIAQHEKETAKCA